MPAIGSQIFILQTATAPHISGPIYETFFWSGSLKPGSFGYFWQTALVLIGPIYEASVQSMKFTGITPEKINLSILWPYDFWELSMIKNTRVLSAQKYVGWSIAELHL